MKYIKLYDGLDFSDIDDYNDDVGGCKLVIIFVGIFYVGYIVKDGNDYRFKLLGDNDSLFSINLPRKIRSIVRLHLDGVNIDIGETVSYNSIIELGIPIVIIGYDVSVRDFKHNIDDYVCDDEQVSIIKDKVESSGLI
jgi:hypothetical protein